jgi:hypothetical protein
MPETLESTPETQPDTKSVSVPETPEEFSSNSAFDAVNVCRRAYFEAFAAYCHSHGGPEQASEYQCQKSGRKAYCDSLPTLSSRQNILSFMACVAEGVLMEAIRERTSGKLIYAAQAAIGALPREPKPRKKTKKRTPPHPRSAKKGNRVEPQLTTSEQAA